MTMPDTTKPTVHIPTLGRIPVRNVWLLMLYESDLYRELPRAESVDLEEDPDNLPNIIAELLIHAVERRLRRNLSFGYRRRRADLTRVRGRIGLLRTERRQLIQRGRIACAFDELTVDTPRKRTRGWRISQCRTGTATDAGICTSALSPDSTRSR